MKKQPNESAQGCVTDNQEINCVGQSYGERAVGKTRSFKLKRATVIKMLDDAFNAGHAEAMLWGKGVARSLREEIAGLKQEVAKRTGNAKLYRCAAELLMEKHGWKPEGRQ